MTDTALQLETGADTPAIRLWGGRFAAEPSVEMDRLNRSLPVDHRLWRRPTPGARRGPAPSPLPGCSRTPSGWR